MTLRFLLDEHYPPALVILLAEHGVDAVGLLGDRPSLPGTPDSTVLRQAATEGRVVVTEDVSTFPAAVRDVPDHVGVVYCRSSVFRRTPAGLASLADALMALASNPPAGLGDQPVVWWLEPR
ncbi:MAG: DUF5615 family PIN-like protein [Propionibacteriaceae bacterium]|nr:DUF5615 family PIN-like protein [Propionibacteriaceae bacterium]